MRKHTKKNLPLLLLLCVLLLTACDFAGGDARDWDENILVYAKLSGSSFNQDAIDAFNQSHTDMQIEVRDYYSENPEEAKQNRERLMVEIAAGKVPDIIDMGNAYAGMLPYRSLAQKGFLENLWPYIEGDPELGRESLMEAPLKAAEVDGGLYMVFDSVRIQTLFGAEGVVGDRTSWSLQDLQDVFASMPADSTILEFYTDKATLCSKIFPMVLDAYVDWETGKCSFDSAGFRGVLEFISSFPDESPWTDSSVEKAISAELTERVLSGRQMLISVLILSAQEIQHYDALLGGRCSPVGYPVEDGSVGSCFVPAGTKLAMSSVCRNKDAAWEFIRQYLLPQGRGGIDLCSSIPVNLADYNKAINYMKRAANKHQFRFWDSPAIEIPRLSEEDAQRFTEFFNSVDKIRICNDTIYDLVVEQCGPYFAGDKTLDDTIRLLNNRVGLYVNEQK